MNNYLFILLVKKKDLSGFMTYIVCSGSNNLLKDETHTHTHTQLSNMGGTMIKIALEAPR
jgi:hypothetical protein